MKVDRLTKQLIIGLVFLLVIGFAGFRVYRAFFPAPTCVDAIQNHGEEGIDCGPVCGTLCAPAIQPLELRLAQAFPARAGEYDLLFEVYNPNDRSGSSDVPYVAVVSDSQGQELARRRGTLYILPKQTRFVVESSLALAAPPADVAVTLGEPRWQTLDAAQTAIDFRLKREHYVPGPSAWYEGVIMNDSPYDFGRVDVAVLLIDAANQVIGINRTDIETVTAGSERFFKVQWPFSVSGTVARVQVEATTNAFENSNFLKTHGGVPEPFQEFQ